MDKLQLKSIQTLVSAGIGWMNGERLTVNDNELENVYSNPGIAFEFGLTSAGNTIEYGLSF